MTSGYSEVRRACGAVLDDLETVIQTAAARLDDIPSYRGLQGAELLSTIRRNVRLGLSVITEGRRYSEEELRTLSATAASRARSGVPVDELLDAFSVVERTTWEAVEQKLVLESLTVEQALRLSALRLGNQHDVLRHVSREHRRVELSLAREAQERRAATVVGLLQGGLPEVEVESAVRRLGLDPSRPLHVWRLRGDPDVLDAGVSAFARLSEDIVGLSTSGGSAPGLVAGTAGPVPVAELAAAYRKASQAFETAVAFGLSGVHTQDGLGLRAAVVAHPSIGQDLRHKYVAPLDEAGTLGEALLETTQVYLTLGARRDATAKALHLHGNTVSYRLNRFAALTGVDLEDHAVLAELWWLFRDLEVRPG